MYRWCLALFMSVLTACSQLPPQIKDAPQPDWQLTDMVGKAAQHQGQQVRWGGQILNVSNDETGATIEVIQFPLNGYGRPLIEQKSAGRFIAKTTEFIDPQIYEVDSLLTVAGTIEGEIEQKVDKKVLKLPVVQVDLLHRWSAYVPQPMPTDYWPYPYDYYGYGWDYPYWRAPRMYPYPYYWR